MGFRVWYSDEAFAEFIIDNTSLSKEANLQKSKLYESDANNSRNFHSLPEHIKKILYLDAPDLIVEIDHEPIFSVEVSTEAGTGHNAFQRFARLAAAVENNVPAFYIYPEAVIIHRKGTSTKWDSLNPLIFDAMESVMVIYGIPALLYYFPSDFRKHPDPSNSPNSTSKGLVEDPSPHYGGSPDRSDNEMKSMFSVMDTIIQVFKKHGIVEGRSKLLKKKDINQRRQFMKSEYSKKGGNHEMSPLSATETIKTEFLLNYLKQYEKSGYKIGELLNSREETLIYKVNARFRGDPYPGALAAIDYLICREGETFEERCKNLVIVWGNLSINDSKKTISISSTKASINDFVKKVQKSEKKNILNKKYSKLKPYEIPRYYMQVRYGSTYSKAKEIRIYSYFADAIIFKDGALWRDG